MTIEDSPVRTLTRNVAFGAAMTLALLGSAVAPATAAPGEAFDPNKPLVFVSKGETGSAINLFQQVIGTDGSADYTQIGTGSNNDFNALTYNLDDNFLYAITNSSSGGVSAGTLIRIDSEGNQTPASADGAFPRSLFGGGISIIDQGAYNPDDQLMYALSTDGGTMVKIDTTTGTSPGTVSLSATAESLGGGWDIAYSQGFFWSLNGNQILRIDPTTGELDTFTVPGAVGGAEAGAAWTFGNGNLGFSHNANGQISQIKVEDAAGTSPTFTVIAQTPGRSSARNDGANVPGTPVDLAVTKTSEGFAAGEVVTYTITVTNNGAGWSTGWTINDDVPAALTGVAADSDDADCTVVDNEVECAGGELEPGESATVTVAADVPSDQTDDVENTVTVTGNESDPDASNNSDTVVDSVDSDSPDVPDSPSVPAGGEGAAGPSLGLLGGLGLLGVATLGGGALLRRRLI